MKKDTIAAIGTAMTNSGIGIIRISGQEAFEIAGRAYRREGGGRKDFSKVPSHTAHFGYVYDGEEMLDQVLILVMKGPHSYTGEDTAEINCHGGVLVMRRILETVVKHGARLADPGEFTKRAFLNGKMDLSQAEAVIDLINAKNQYALRSSVSQLKGSVSAKVRELREKILYHVAFIESALDDPEHISLEGYGEGIKRDLDFMERELGRLLASADDGRVMAEGIKTVILGKPNAGKSSLMNLLVGEERAIVTHVAGTTRDTLEEHVRLQGISLNLVDTAGIRETQDVVERIGVEKARAVADQADLIIYVVDASCPLDENDDQVIRLMDGRRSVVILNKTDLDMVVSQEKLEEKTGQKVIPVSAKEGTGINDLEEEIKSMFYQGKIDFNDQVYITNARHKAALEEALSSLKLVEKSLREGMPEDFFSIDLMEAYQQLGTIVGEAVEDDLVNMIFAKFCMGK